MGPAFSSTTIVPLSELEVLLLDCQTTGASPRKGHLLEVAWCRTSASRAADLGDDDLFSTTVALPEGESVPRRITRLTGIGQQELEDAPERSAVWQLLLQEAREMAAAHVRATAVVWSHLVELLESQWQIASLWELRLFLEEVKPTREGGREYPLPRERRLALPETPGVYHMLGKGGEVLYLGKATSLKSRVNSYFQRPRHDNQRTLEWLTQAYDVAVFPERSPLEAALREADQIKEIAPPYNVALRQREEAVWFTTGDLDSVSPQVDGRHCLGPVPVRGSLAAMGLLRALLAGTRDTTPLEEVHHTGLPRELEAGCLEQGLKQLGARFPRWLAAPLDARALHHLGAWLWRERRRQELELESQQEPDAEPEQSEERVWDPTRVAGALEYSIYHAARLLRRAHWLCQISESSLAWEPAVGGRRLLVIQGGQVTGREELDPGAPVPAPPGHGRSLMRRMGVFDPVVHDRLRVLTTELRRLVSQGAPLELRLGPRQALDRRALARRLWWF